MKLEPLLEPEKIIDEQFSTTKLIEKPTTLDLIELRDWKNKVVTMRDANEGKFLYKVFNEEVSRIVVFLNKFSH